jgi:hypothetical protein
MDFLEAGEVIGGEGLALHLGAEYLATSQRILARAVFQGLAFLAREMDRERTLSGH